MQSVVSRPSAAMHSVKPKLVPTLVCLAVVGLVSALLPYPGFENQITVIDSPINTSSRK